MTTILENDLADTKKEKSALSNGTIIAWVKSHINKPQSTREIQVKTIIDKKVYRVNFMSLVQTKDCFIPESKFIDCRLIEIIENGAGLHIVDLTL